MTEANGVGSQTRAASVVLLVLSLAGPASGGTDGPAPDPGAGVRYWLAQSGVDGDDEYETEEDGEEDEEYERLEFAVELNLEAGLLRDFALDRERRDDRLVREAELAFELRYQPRENLVLFGAASLIAEREDFRGDFPDESVDALERGETWVRFLRLLDRDASATVGRQSFEEPRRWWWDDDLDAVRLDAAGADWRAYVGLAREVARADTSEDFIDPEVDELERLLAQVGWSWSDAVRLDLFGLVQRDRSGQIREDRVLDTERVDESDLDADWFGLRLSGDLDRGDAPAFRYWADLATVSGDEAVTEFEEVDARRSRAGGTERQRLRAWAIDLGTEWTFATPGAPSVSLRYAQGSGDRDPDDNTDRNYREPGLRDTDDEFRLYGELLRPALSNLHVATLALGLDTFAGGRASIGLHRFRQVHAADELADSRIELDPTGDSTEIGDEVNVVLRFDDVGDLELEFAAAAFRAGDAYGPAAGKRAYSLFAQATYGF